MGGGGGGRLEGFERKRLPLGHIQKLVGDHTFCFKEVGRAGGGVFLWGGGLV